jgi:non-ribosomal peptide synthetase component F
VVKALSRRAGATLFMTTLTVYIVLLRYHSKAKDLDDVIVGTNVANRNHLELEPLIGFFVNQLVLRLKMSGDPGFMELLARARKMVLDAFLYQEVPFEKVVEKLRPERKEKHSPFHQVLFTLVAKQDKPPVFSDIRIEEVPLATETAKFDLTLSVIDRGETLIALLDYNAGLFKTSTIERMLRQYETLLGLVAGNPNIHLSELLRLLRDADKEEQRKIAGAFKKSDLDRIRGMRSKTIAVKSTE